MYAEVTRDTVGHRKKECDLRKSKRRIAIVLAFLVGAYGLYMAAHPPSAVDVMQDFYASEGWGEDALMDPLILHTDIVAPTVIEEIRNRDMKRRRYAIGFLGVRRVQEALPVLRSILADPSEVDYIRADALESIYQIDNEEWMALAREFSSREDGLGCIARGLIDGAHIPFERSYWQALIRHHD